MDIKEDMGSEMDIAEYNEAQMSIYLKYFKQRPFHVKLTYHALPENLQIL